MWKAATMPASVSSQTSGHSVRDAVGEGFIEGRNLEGKRGFVQRCGNGKT
jgi:hypothetical protein